MSLSLPIASVEPFKSIETAVEDCKLAMLMEIPSATIVLCSASEILTSSALPGRVSFDQFSGSAQLYVPAPPSHETDASKRRGSRVSNLSRRPRIFFERARFRTM